MEKMKDVTLVLQDGTTFKGKSFGYEKPVAGEVVFNTAMMGYPESLTDPSYAGQLMTLTYPLVGNYGVPHWNANESLSDWLKREQVPGVTGIDTRQLTKVLREHGVMMGHLEYPEIQETPETVDYGSINWVDRVSCKDVIRYNEGAGKKVVLVDCGVKHNIIRCLVQK